ncbi:MAG: hypothetical protein ACI9YE_001782, partial [Psychroserpens sp.]
MSVQISVNSEKNSKQTPLLVFYSFLRRLSK